MWKAEWLPWYRARNYKGNLTEVEKRQLDAFRAQPTHPATLSSDLPEEVQRYITRVELELYDAKQEMAAGRAFFWSTIGALLLMLGFAGVTPSTIWLFEGGALLLVVPWIVYAHEWKTNAEKFLPSDPDIPNPIDEAIRYEWEINYLLNLDRQQREGTSDRAISLAQFNVF
jgi:hypothetical protein